MTMSRRLIQLKTTSRTAQLLQLANLHVNEAGAADVGDSWELIVSRREAKNAQ